jgi:hypothetical protein
MLTLKKDSTTNNNVKTIAIPYSMKSNQKQSILI